MAPSGPNNSLHATVLDVPRRPLELRTCLPPHPGSGQLLVKLAAFAIRRINWHMVAGELRNPKHQLFRDMKSCAQLASPEAVRMVLI
jgi:NADPH:quinone reductase-like Zn-dependent oxidoreductase